MWYACWCSRVTGAKWLAKAGRKSTATSQVFGAALRQVAPSPPPAAAAPAATTVALETSASEAKGVGASGFGSVQPPAEPVDASANQMKQLEGLAIAVHSLSSEMAAMRQMLGAVTARG